MPNSSNYIDFISDVYSRIGLSSGDFTGEGSYSRYLKEMILENPEVLTSDLSGLNFLDKFQVDLLSSVESAKATTLNGGIDEENKVITASESIRVISTDSTKSVDINQINEDFYRFLERHSAVFVWTLRHTDFEDGIENAPISEVKNYIRKNRFVTFSWLHSIYSSNQKDSDVIAAILRIIGMTVDNEDYDKLLPLVKAGLSDNSSKAQEAAIMVIEKWRSKNCLDAIQTAQFQSKWIREYAKQIELELITELESC